MQSRLSLPHPVQRFFNSRVARDTAGHGVTLVNRRLFILPTRSGMGFGLLLLLMLLGAINYNNSLAFALTFLLTGLGMVAMHHTYANLLGLRVHVTAARNGFAGRSVMFRVQLENPTGRDHTAVGVTTGADLQRSHVPAGETVTLWVERAAPRRGRLAAGTLTLETTFPLGLFRAWTRAHFDLAAYVYPAPAAADRPVTSAPRRLSEAGDQGRGTDDFRGFRHYHAGDSLRHVNWKAVARDQDWMTKEFGGDRVEELWLDWDTLPGMDPEERLSQLCRWVLEAEQAQRYFGLRLPGRELAPAQGPTHAEHCLQALAEMEV